MGGTLLVKSMEAGSDSDDSGDLLQANVKVDQSQTVLMRMRTDWRSEKKNVTEFL